MMLAQAIDIESDILGVHDLSDDVAQPLAVAQRPP